MLRSVVVVFSRSLAWGLARPKGGVVPMLRGLVVLGRGGRERERIWSVEMHSGCMLHRFIVRSVRTRAGVPMPSNRRQRGMLLRNGDREPRQVGSRYRYSQDLPQTTLTLATRPTHTICIRSCSANSDCNGQFGLGGTRFSRRLYSIPIRTPKRRPARILRWPPTRTGNLRSLRVALSNEDDT